MSTASVQRKKLDPKTLAPQHLPTGPVAEKPQPPLGLPDDALHILIAKRAYELYMVRGAGHGSALDDWLQAEREILRPDHA
ncbi:MAG: DUF2934 domain-containing protein [Nitrospira sp.]|nr:DUF2934 domain-containing protein [Nitrospira sp.]